MWHPFFGSTKAGFDRRYCHYVGQNVELYIYCTFIRMFEALAHVRKQLQFLWSGQLVLNLFSQVLALTPAAVELPSSKGTYLFTRVSLYLGFT